MLKNDWEGLSELLGLLYDASTQANQWPEFCMRLMAHLQSTDINIQLQETTSRVPWVKFTTTPSECLKPYFEHYHAVNPYYHRGLHKMRPGFIGRSHEECPPEEFEETEFHRNFFRHLDLFHSCIMTVLNGQGLFASVSLSRPKRMGIYDDEDERLMRFLMPHLQRAFRIADLISDLGNENKVLAEALDKLQQGVLIVSHSGCVIFMNSSSRQITERKDGLSIDRQGFLQTAYSREGSQLRQMIKTASQRESGLSLNCGGVIQLERPSGMRPLSLLVAPLNLESSYLNFQQPYVLIFITDPEQQMETAEQVLRRLYELTPAEARLAAILAQGKNVVEVAEELHVTQNTARTHLKRIFEKTGAKRQSDLVKLLLNSPATLK